MKKYILLSIMIIFIFSQHSSLFSQEGLLGTDAFSIDSVCGLVEDPEELVQYGGKYLPAEGVVRALVVFVKFPDDQLVNSNWPLNANLPNYASHYIDSEVSQNPTPKSITDYFYVMSNGLLHLIGDIYPQVVTTQHSRDWYINYFDNLWGVGNKLNERFGYINREVLEAIDGTVDFSLYDNWTRSGGNHINEPDGKVDMIFIVYRNHARDYPVSQWRTIERGLGVYFWGIAVLGGHDTPDFLTNDNVIIDMSYFPGSGLMYKNGFANDSYWGGDYGYMIGVATHEFGHYLFGSGHPTNENLGLMGGTNKALNSVERERLGWLQFTDLTEPNASIPDYVTQNVALRIQLNGTSEYFAIENRQQLSIYDDMEDMTGLFVTHVTGASTNSIGSMDLECADGRFDWYVSEFVQNPYSGNPNSPPDMAIWRHSGVSSVNRINGIDERDAIYAYNPYLGQWGYYYKVFDKLLDGSIVYTAEYLGDAEDAFNLEYNQIFSPWSNPTTHKANGTSSNIGLEVVSYNPSNHSFNLKFYNGNPEDAPPSKPAWVDISVWVNNPLISWSPNIEPDLSHYEVWKFSGAIPYPWPPTFQKIAETTESYYIDNSVNLRQKTGEPYIAIYKIKAVDFSLKESVFSQEVSVTYLDGNILPPEKKDKINSEVALNVINKFKLFSNFPNPFNPITTITFELPEETYVNLDIFDISGKIIKSLISEYKASGVHKIEWDGRDALGNQVSSGVYFYRLKSEKFNNTRRMLLIR